MKITRAAQTVLPKQTQPLSHTNDVNRMRQNLVCSQRL